MPNTPSESPEISVVVCTRNREGPLAELLGSMAELRVPPGLAWELLIVDNGSTDGTRGVVESFADRLPVRYTFEGTAGLSNARNRGVHEARGRYLCWTDDDAMVDPEWLASYAEAFRTYPEAAVFGGRVIPRLEGPTPAWFQRLSVRWPLNAIVAERNFGDAPRPLDYNHDVTPWGVNFAIRAEEQRRHRYDPMLGVSPNQRRSGEESQLMFEIIDAGATGWWLPGPKVFHIFPAQRQSRSYFFKHFAAIGESLAYLDHSREVHVMNRDGRQPRLLRANPLKLDLMIAFNTAAYYAFTGLGMTLRSLYHLRRAGLYSGVASYRRSLTPAA